MAVNACLPRSADDAGAGGAGAGAIIFVRPTARSILVGHSYGPAPISAFKIATDPRVSSNRIRSLSLIEPVAADAAAGKCTGPGGCTTSSPSSAREVQQDLWNGSVLEAIDKFCAFWNGSGPREAAHAERADPDDRNMRKG